MLSIIFPLVSSLFAPGTSGLIILSLTTTVFLVVVLKSGVYQLEYKHIEINSTYLQLT